MVTVTIQLIAETASLHAYSVQQLFRAMQTSYAQQPLVQVASWCIGEYGDQMFCAVEDDETLQVSSGHRILRVYDSLPPATTMIGFTTGLS